jgi:predicted ATP-grasp superfamily ATP-dependent carboligase
MDDDALLTVVTELAKRIGNRPALFPSSDALALFCARYASRLAETCRITSTPYESLLDIVSKDALYHHAQAIGVRVPAFLAEPTSAQLADWTSAHGGPYLVKPFYVGVASARLREKNALLPDASALTTFFARHGESGLIVQQLLSGGDGHIFDAYGLRGADGQVTGMVSHRRWRQHKPDLGATSYGEIPAGISAAAEQELFVESKKLLARMNYHGIFGIEWLHDRAADRYYLIDFNARPFLTIGHLLDSGINLPALAMRELKTGKTPAVTAKINLAPLLWVDLLRDIESLRERRAAGQEVPLGPWLVSVLKSRSHAYASWRDPGPGFLRLLQMLRRLPRALMHSATPATTQGESSTR